MYSSFDEDLTPLLSIVKNEDLEPIVEYIKNANLSENLTSSEYYIKFNPDHKKYVSVIEDEIHKFGGNTIANLFRASGPSYKTIVCDVANRLDVDFNKNQPIHDIEQLICIKVFGNAWKEMSDDKRKEFIDCAGIDAGILKKIPKSFPILALQTVIKNSGYIPYMLSYVVANAFSIQILGKTLSYGAGNRIGKAMTSFVGPLGLVITTIWAVLDLAGPAYRVTIPCVIHIGFLRNKYLLKICKECSHPYSKNFNFCPNCGAKL